MLGMKKQNILILLIGISVLAGIFFWQYEWVVQKDVIYLQKGPTIIADKAWTGGQIVYYQKDGAISMLAKQDVAQVVEGEYIERINGAQFLHNILKQVMHEDDPWGGLLALLKSHWLTAILSSAMVLVIVSILQRIFQAKNKRRRQAAKAGENPAALDAVIPKHMGSTGDGDEDQIIRYFLNLFRIQLGAPETAVVEYELMETVMEAKNKVFELRIRHDGEWAKRRMTIGPLGEESGSKSKCYYVIFDVHIVIKIPPKPITDCSVYIDNIRKEGEIVARLLPRECLIPRVAVILRRIRQFHDEDSLSPEKMESRYIRWLTNSPEAQNYLKIGSTFVFFMDLSKYFFLAHIIDQLHNIVEKSSEEILSNPDIIWNAHEFAGRYGQRNSSICFKMQDVYHAFEADLRRHFEQGEKKIVIPSYQLKAWFLGHLAGKEVSLEESPQAESVNMCIKEILSNQAQTVSEYQETLKQHLRDMMFIRNKNQIAGIVVNLLELLAWLGEKQVAMRDLKPDNLLVAGDRSQYPRFLLNPEQFSIGLIDVETAVYYGTEEGGIKQPQLGGTPFYATPSHLIKNDWLEKIFGDLTTVLHLQDWHATIAIIYKVVTGATLFERTGRLLPAVRMNLHKHLTGQEEFPAVVKDVSRMFWRAAELEFQNKLKDKAQVLQSVTVKFKENIHSILKSACEIVHQAIDGMMAKAIAVQRFFPGESNHRNLRKATYAHIGKLMERCGQGEGHQSDNKKPLPVLEWLETIGRLKQQSEELRRYKEQLDEEAPGLSAYAVMQIMFQRVLYFMFRPEWTEAQLTEFAPGENGNGERTYEATI